MGRKIKVELRQEVEDLHKRHPSWTHKDIAKEVGKSRSRVTQILSSRDVTLKGIKRVRGIAPKPKPKELEKPEKVITAEQIKESLFGEGTTGFHDVLLQFEDDEVYQDFVEWYHFTEKLLGKRPKLWKYNSKTGDLVIRRIPLDGNRSFTVNMHHKGTIQVRIACTGFRNEIKTLEELDAINEVILRGFLKTDVSEEDIKSDWHPARYTPEGVEVEAPWFNVGVKVSEIKEYWRMYFTEGRIKNEEIPMETAPLSDLRKRLQINGETKEAVMLLAKQNESVMQSNVMFGEKLEKFGMNLDKHLAVLDRIDDGIRKFTKIVDKLGKKLR